MEESASDKDRRGSGDSGGSGNGGGGGGGRRGSSLFSPIVNTVSNVRASLQSSVQQAAADTAQRDSRFSRMGKSSGAFYGPNAKRMPSFRAVDSGAGRKVAPLPPAHVTRTTVGGRRRGSDVVVPTPAVSWDAASTGRESQANNDEDEDEDAGECEDEMGEDEHEGPNEGDILHNGQLWEDYYAEDGGGAPGVRVDEGSDGEGQGQVRAAESANSAGLKRFRPSQFAGNERTIKPQDEYKRRLSELRAEHSKVGMDGKTLAIARFKQLLFVDVILPHFRFMRVWEPWIVVCVLWNAILLPYNLAFDALPGEQNEVVSVLDGIIDFVFVADLFLNFATAYVDDWGSLVVDRREIGRAYLSKWFWVDLPATLPFELFVPPNEATAINMVKCIRLIRIGKILKFLERFRFANSARIMRLFASLMLVCHWIGCLWFFIGYNAITPCNDWPEYFDPSADDVLLDGAWTTLDGPVPDGKEAYCSWLSVHRLGTDRTPINTKYLKSVYWAVTTITSVGYGDIVPVTDGETLFTILNMLLGAGIYAMIFSNFVSYIARIDQASTKYSEKMEDIRGQMRYLRLPRPIQDRVEQYFEYVWLCHKGLLDRENYFFDELPLPLHLECAEFLHLETVQKNPLFRNCSRSFLRGVLVRLKPQLVVPGEFVVNRGDAATAMYFVARGELEVLSDEGEQAVALAKLSVGDYFGDIGVLTKRKRTASIRALSYCDLHYLVADELRELLLVYEDDARNLSQNALDFVKKFEEEVIAKETKLRGHGKTAELSSVKKSMMEARTTLNLDLIDEQSSTVLPDAKLEATMRSQQRAPVGGKGNRSKSRKV